MTIKLLQESIEKLCHISSEKDLLDIAQKARNIKGKNDKLDCIKIKTSDL